MEEAAEKGIDPDEISLEICIQCETFNRGTVEPWNCGTVELWNCGTVGPYGAKLFSGFP